MLYVLRHENMFEFKICNGVMMLMFDYLGNLMPMTMLDVHNGKPITNFTFEKEKDSEEFEFLEQYNHQILVKYKNKPLEVVDIISKEKKVIPKFETPEAFIFIYEKEVFLSLKAGCIKLYSIEGQLLSDFNGMPMYSQEPELSDKDQSLPNNVY